MAKPKDKLLEFEVPLAAQTSPDRARELFSNILPTIQDLLTGHFGAHFEVAAGELNDPVGAVAKMNHSEEKEVILTQTVSVWRGWREGAYLLLSWDQRRPGKLSGVIHIGCKLEDTLGNLLILWPGVILGGMQLLSGKAQLLRMLLWGAVGAGAGFLVYCVLAVPILHLLTRRFRAASREIATKIQSFAEQALRASFQERLYSSPTAGGDPMGGQARERG